MRDLIIFSLIFALIQSAVAAPMSQAELKELQKIPAYQQGAKAMSDLLPELASRQFRNALDTPELSETTKRHLTMALAEALIRSSATPQGSDFQASEALTLLASPTLEKHPDNSLWKAQALAILGRYRQSEETLASIAPAHPHFHQSQLARARILLALNQIPEAIAVLQSCTQSQNEQTRNNARLLTAEIQTNLGQVTEARQSLETVESPIPSAAQIREYLQARIALADNQPADAISRFKSLVTAPDHLSKRLYHACILGLSDALATAQREDEAIATLEDYITNHPNSPMLQASFDRLGRLLPDGLASDHPSMQRLELWSGEFQPASQALYISGESADAIPPYQAEPSEYDDLVALSLYLRARLLARSPSPGNYSRALALLNRLRSLHPAHTLPPSEVYLHLASASLLDTAEIQLKQNKAEQASFTLEAMEKTAFSPLLKDQANILLGRLQIEASDYSAAFTAFNYARESTSIEIAAAASINSGISALLSSNLKAFDQVFNSTNTPRIRTSLQLERALWKCRNNDVSGRSDLEKFIMTHPGHPRESEARLALAAACVDISPPDIILSKAQLEIIEARLSDAKGQYAITRIRIRAEELNQQWESAATVAETFIRQFPNDPRIPGVMLKQGEAYYHNEDFNKARRVFQSINERFPTSPFAPYASFYTAMAARLGGTSQAREESVTLFQKLIDGDHPLKNEARIQQGRVLIDLRRYEEAQATLTPILDPATSAPLSLRRDAGVLLADSLHRQGVSDPQKYRRAVDIYDQLLAEKNLPSAWNHRLHFLKGQTLESMKEFDAALESYYSVVSIDNAPEALKGKDIEWFWFYRCGFKALSMLENEKRWQAAVKLAQRIASFDGPRAEEAYQRADNLARTHMIWPEEK